MGRLNPPIPLGPIARGAPSTPPAVDAFPALGTTAVLVVSDPAALDAVRAIVAGLIADLDRACSRFRDDSELSALNATPATPVEVSPLLLDAVEVALRAARITGGRVSPTVGTAMRLIGYDRDFGQMLRSSLAAGGGPDPGANGPGAGGAVAPVIRIRPVPGWRMVVVDRAASTVRIPPGVELDLGATAKALCADRAASGASEATGAGVLVSLGGDIAVAGAAPEGGWVIRVSDDHAGPTGGGDDPGQTISLTAGGLATSSTTVRRWAGPPRRGDGAPAPVHHIIHPSTGAPAAGGWRTATAVAATCVDANIASTAAIILGPRAPSWLEERGLAARLVADDGAVTRVGGWPAEPGEDPDDNPDGGGRAAAVGGPARAPFDPSDPGRGRAS